MVCLQVIFCDLRAVNPDFSGSNQKRIVEGRVGETSFIAIQHLVPLKENTARVG